jgi:hypothetical protein
MIEHLIVYLVVGVALYFTGKELFSQARGRGCSGCDCKSKCAVIEKASRPKDHADKR